MGRGIQKKPLILIPAGLNLLHTVYLNSNILLVIKGKEMFEFRAFATYDPIY